MRESIDFACRVDETAISEEVLERCVISTVLKCLSSLLPQQTNQNKVEKGNELCNVSTNADSLYFEHHGPRRQKKKTCLCTITIYILSVTEDEY